MKLKNGFCDKAFVRHKISLQQTLIFFLWFFSMITQFTNEFQWIFGGAQASEKWHKSREMNSCGFHPKRARSGMSVGIAWKFMTICLFLALRENFIQFCIATIRILNYGNDFNIRIAWHYFYFNKSCKKWPDTQWKYSRKVYIKFRHGSTFLLTIWLPLSILTYATPLLSMSSCEREDQ